MADSILRLKVDSQEYDQKIKRAAEGIQHYAQKCREAGGTLEYVEQETLDFVRAIGQMETVSRTATGKLNEMKQAYVELSMQYKQLTEAEKQSPIGKAMTESLDQLKGRITETKQQLNETNKEIGETSRVSDSTSVSVKDLASAFGLNASKLTVMGTAIAAAKGALSVFTDAMNSNRQTIDTWGREMESAKSLYDGFLIALNNGDISGFLSNINQIVGAARSAYNALSDLKEFNAFNRINVQNARTGLNETITDYRNGNASKDQVRQANEILKNELRERGKREQAVYEENIEKVAKEYHTSAEKLKDLLSGKYVDWENAKHSYIQGSGQNFSVTPMASPNVFTGVMPSLKVTNYAATPQEHLSELARTIPVERLDALQQLGQQASATETEISQLDKSLSRLLNKKDPKPTGGNTKIDKDEFTEIIGLIPNAEELVKSLQQQIRESWDEGEISTLTDQLKIAEAELKRLKDIGQDVDLDKLFPEVVRSGGSSTSFGQQLIQSINQELAASVQNADVTALRTLLETTIKNSIEGIDIPTDELMEKIIGDGTNIPDEYWKNLQEQINEKLKEKGLATIDIDFNTGKSSEKKEKTTSELMGEFNKGLATVNGGINSVVGGIQQLGLEIPKEIQGVVSTISGISSLITGIAALLTLIEANTAATAGASIVDAIVPLAGGGIVPRAAFGRIIPGNSFSGDNLFAGNAMVNSGELVLNRAQQGVLASELQGRNNGTYESQPYIDGEQIFLGLQAYMRRSGKGEIVTANR